MPDLAPTVWGPTTWACLHLLCMGAPERLEAQQRRSMQSFIESLGEILPCAKCRDHFRENLTVYPLNDEALQTSAAIFAWSVNVHNRVNTVLGKKTWSLEEAKGHWSSVAKGKLPVPCEAKLHPMIDAVAFSRTSWNAWGWIVGAAILGVFVGALVARRTLNKPRNYR